MNEIKFLAKDEFPVSTDTLNRLQEATSMVATLALLGGSNYILSGCEEKDGEVGQGIIVIDGEILPFMGGAPLECIRIKETSETLEAFDELYPEAYIDRVAVFTEESKYKWSNWERVETLQELKIKIESLRGESPGFVKMWSGLPERLEKEYLLCNGDTVNTADYPDLAYYFGKKDESSFKLPDLRQKFIIGYDNSVTDYDEIGKTGGEKEHILTIDEMPEHKHIIPWGENVNQDWNPPWGYATDYLTGRRGSNGNDTDNAWAWTSPSGENKPHENRPPFMY